MKKIILLVIIFAHTVIITAQVTVNDPIILAYFPSWSENYTSTNQDSKLRRIPPFVNYVFLAFAKPDLRYTKDSFDISNTGIEMSYDGCTLKESIAALKNKGIQVILSIGGETYWTSNTIYDQIEYQQIKDLVDDFGFAGIDWDFEPNGSFANIGSPENVQHFIDFFNNSRAIMPRSEGYILACAPSGVGALGGQSNNDTASPYAFENRNTLTGESDTELYNGPAQTNGINLFGFSATGHMIPVIQSVGNKIDIIAYQGYNAGGSMNRSIMYDAFAYYAEQYDFKVVAGIHYPNEPWGPYYEYTHENVASLSNHIKTHPDRQGKKDGIMIWQLLLEAANSSAYSYLNVASKVLNGSTEATAISEANSFSLAPYSGGADGCTTGGGDVYCGVTEYNNTADYPTPNTSVYYSCKIWENQWYANANEIPGENSVWLETGNCTEDSACTLSINEEELLENIAIYTNNGFIYIEELSNKDTLKTVHVISISGQKLMSKSLDNGRLEIDMRSLSKGFYILELDFGQYRIGKKISVN
ncbi:glycosyl hydrolase family 18 protein [uncultured Aquimarina sp.]|uniref:glycosyl hydrolase family 18 protein n=1 Tax=uncultured Aquimarina sp. TaxID=575652 RepID=UPI002631D2F7|nr:glycosyl hydrolase family 18 protein [uncultured Aquimarina sp.]